MHPSHKIHVTDIAGKGDGGERRNTETKYQHHKNFLKYQSVLISPVANSLSVMGKMNETTGYKLAKTVYYRVTF